MSINNHRSARIFGNIIGYAVLAVFTTLLIYPFSSLGTFLQRSGLFVGVYVALATAATLGWRRVDGNPRRWLLQALFSIVAGIAWVLIDVTVGYLRAPSSSLLESVTSSRLFFITLLLCPGYTAIALSGWARSLIVRDEVRTPQSVGR